MRAGFLPHSIAGCSGLVELVPNLGEVRLGALRSGRFVVGAGDRAASSFLDFGLRGSVPQCRSLEKSFSLCADDFEK
ncbi:hypothetical protein D6T64_05265 [Cryobacterium melibiosiphilum]|uniref:Uncharacterized protein n=1 Tax=Cryobacterium melibiosiphilum TaxID=995039 RepID=A0A3A5MS25_9MICO|nr:hypothetical protein D6T64_05265 [Cryobacterium melibiosiphilum]